MGVPKSDDKEHPANRIPREQGIVVGRTVIIGFRDQVDQTTLLQLLKSLYERVNVGEMKKTGGVEAYWACKSADLDEVFDVSWFKVTPYWMMFRCSSTEAARFTIETLVRNDLPFFKNGKSVRSLDKAAPYYAPGIAIERSLQYEELQFTVVSRVDLATLDFARSTAKTSVSIREQQGLQSFPLCSIVYQLPQAESLRISPADYAEIVQLCSLKRMKKCIRDWLREDDVMEQNRRAGVPLRSAICVSVVADGTHHYAVSYTHLTLPTILLV